MALHFEKEQRKTRRRLLMVTIGFVGVLVAGLA